MHVLRVRTTPRRSAVRIHRGGARFAQRPVPPECPAQPVKNSHDECPDTQRHESRPRIRPEIRRVSEKYRHDEAEHSRGRVAHPRRVPGEPSRPEPNSSGAPRNAFRGWPPTCSPNPATSAPPSAPSRPLRRPTPARSCGIPGPRGVVRPGRGPRTPRTDQRQAAAHLDPDDADLRAGLIGALTIGLVISRHLLHPDAVSDAATDRIVELLCPAVHEIAHGSTRISRPPTGRQMSG